MGENEDSKKVGEQPIVPQGTTNTNGSTPPQPPTSPTAPIQPQPTVTNPTATAVSPTPAKVNNNEELINYLEQQSNEYKPLSEDELKKLRRKQRIEGIISGVSDAAQSIANLYFTTQYAPNMYNAEKGMSAKTKERFDKEKAERDASNDKFYNYAMNLANLKNQERAFEASREDRAADVEFRNKDYDERVRQWQAGFDRDEKWKQEEGARWERQFNLGVQQFTTTSALERNKLSLEAQKIAYELQKGQMTFNLGSGIGNVTLSSDKLNAQTVSRIYNTLDASIRAKVQGDPIVQNGLVVRYKAPSTEAMLIAIGANVGQSPATQNAIRQVAGLELGEKPKGY
jgi:hypothetical protein